MVGDVALRKGGVLVGRVTTSEGVPQAGAPVSLRHHGRELAKTVTDANGVFALAGLRGGTYEVIAADTAVSLRLWVPGTAPPVATQGALLTTGDPVVRGQGPFYGVNMLNNPWVLATLIAAAIAIPLATQDDDAAS
jgi:hypothetical protein